MSDDFKGRKIKLSVRVTEEEQKILKEKMAVVGTSNQEAYMRKMALDGLIVKLELPELKKMLSLLRYTSNNINQIAKRLNESGRIHQYDVQGIKDNQERLWKMASLIISKLAQLK